MSPKKIKKIGKSEYRVVDEYGRVEKGNADGSGVFRSQCPFCKRELLTPNAMGAHKHHC